MLKTPFRFARAALSAPLNVSGALPLRSLLVGALLIGLSAPAAFAADEDLAAAAFERRDYTEAANLWEERANRGDMEAASQLGNLYRLGLGVEQDAERARNLLLLAADAGVSEAQISLGLMHLKAEGAPFNANEGAKWVRRAADQGDAAGQYNLALLFENGLGVPKDMVQARRWLQNAASQGHARALERLETLSAEVATDPPAAPQAAAARPGPTAGRAAAAPQADPEPPQSILRIRPDGQAAGQVAPSGPRAAPGMTVRRAEEAEAAAPEAPAAAPAPAPTPAAASSPAPAPAARAAAPAPAPAPARAAAPAAAQPPAEAGAAALAAYEKGDFATALNLWAPLAASGDSEAAFRLGRMANRGEGGDQDAEAAWTLWRMAAAQGHRGAVTALHNLAIRMNPADLNRLEAAFTAEQREGR